MNQRGPRKTNYRETPSGSNVLFTLGLVSVVALLIVGWVMTQGGVGSIAEKGLDLTKNMTKINLDPTPTPLPVVPTPTTVAAIPTGPTAEEIAQKYEQELSALKKQNEDYASQIEQMRQNYETQITDLKTQIQLLEMSNKRLRDKK